VSAARKSATRADAKPAARLAPTNRFFARVGRAAAISFSLVGVTLLAGTLGYHYIAELRWLTSFHQSALLLSGMGPVETNLRDAGRMFESIYSLFCGLVLLGSTGILFTPVIHRLLHRFHIEDAGGSD